ncbi:MAG: hypothetical protein PGMFKBFP_01653 [Anaerolineales bacterium]|nr:hypothetical protein [Chloroflexota bacterium]MBV6466343.1 hypothetical protein [Anaerolineales bacterium]HMN13125.1 sulfotransferase [Bellilinea sp.]NOG76735.1 hypothetical protein [Chloroflexota bacterium]GIK09603.1 MAG: hypothetical protein BroJett001_16690 [Chloroflexota bacterium]
MSDIILPNLIIAGVAKAGTTSLFTYLALHPDICSSKIKEIGYFVPLRWGNSLALSLDEYSSYFSHCHEDVSPRYFMEASPGYFPGGKKIAEAMKQTLGDAKIILIFREPISRLFSLFTFYKSRLKLSPEMSFREYVRLCETMTADELRKTENQVYGGLEASYYGKLIADWFETFGDPGVKVLFFEQFRNNPHNVVAGIYDWLELDYEIPLPFEATVENKTMSFRNGFLQRMALKINRLAEGYWRSNPNVKRNLRRLYYVLNGRAVHDLIDNETRMYLQEKFLPSNQRLALELINRGYTTFPEWLSIE